MAYQQLGERIGFVPGGVNVGVVRGDSGAAIMIDAGINETNGRKAVKSIRDELGAEVQAIVTTHGHADHFGANASVVKRTGATVYAPQVDEFILRYPIMSPALLYGGADPVDTLKTNFLLANSSPVDEVYGVGPLTIDGVTFEVIDLAGHSPGQKGLLIDSVFFCADVVLPASVLEKYRIPYLFSVTDHFAALETASHVTCSVAMPGHGPIVERLDESIAANRRLLELVTEAALEHVAEPRTTEDVLAFVFERFDAPVVDAAAYYLLQPTIAAVLSHLERAGEIEHAILDRKSVWRRR